MRAVLPVWVASRVAMLLLTAVGAYVVRPGSGRDLPGFLEQWENWDVGHYQGIAMHGYFSEQGDPHSHAFFPGMPAVLRLVHAVVPDWTAAGLVVSFVAGAVACTALWRLAERESGPRTASRAVLYLLLFPYAVFLFAGYSEALFLAFAVPAWLAARQDRWWLAGLLGAGAATTRVTGMVLGAALAVQYAQQRLQGRPEGAPALRSLLTPQLPALLLPAVPVLAYVTYLHSRTGRWGAYSEALRLGWGRDTVSPLVALRTTWGAATNLDQGSAFLWSFRAEVVALAVGLLLTAVLLAQRRFGEAAFVGLNCAMLSTSAYYASGVRALLVWFPAYLLLARLTATRDWLHATVVWVSAPLMAGLALAFTRGAWLG